MQMWIILGVLAGVVLVIIVVMSVLDRKKAKKVKAEKIALNEEIEEAKFKIATEVLKVVKKNAKKLEKFVPSVGKVKMIDIKSAAKDGLKEIESSRSYKLALEDEDSDKKLFNNFNELKSLNSNLWPTKAVAIVSYFEKVVKEEKELLKEDNFEPKTKKSLFKKKKNK